MAKVRKKRREPRKFTRKMKTKLMVLFLVVFAGLCILIGRLMYIQYTSGEKYERKVLSLQSYDSITIPFQRGNIVDTNGTVLATSVAVYNVILDSYIINSDEEYLEPTLEALVKYFPELDKAELENYIKTNPENRYYRVLKKQSYDTVKEFQDMLNEEDKDGRKVNYNVKGVWFETEYQRNYPFDSLAGSLIGFTSDGNVGTIGLENYYNDTLNGVDGREYGYLNSDSDFEKTVVEAEDGDTIVCSIDANIQSIVEKKIKEFCNAYKDNERKGDGAENVEVLIMDPNNGEILAMADYPTFDLNNPRDLSDYYSKEELKKMSEEEKYEILDGIWQNYCVTTTYEPGSVQKPFTVATGLDTGTLNKNMTFVCNGYEMFSGQKVRCVNRNGHGTETIEKALMDSCNDALMQMSYKIGKEKFLQYQSIYGFGQRTGIDLPGEPNTSGLVFNMDNMTRIDLATNSFGQNYNCTMVQMASAFCSLINGGTYYQPHVVTKITDSDGNAISNISPTVLKQTVSASTSETVKKYLYSVVDEGTGSTAKVDGYSMGGKTGTAQMYDENGKRKKNSYLVSFLGYVGIEKPQLVIYCIVDQPNVKDQAHSTYAQNLAREILEKVLPYMNIYPDEEQKGTNKGLGIKGKEN